MTQQPRNVGPLAVRSLAVLTFVVGGLLWAAITSFDGVADQGRLRQIRVTELQTGLNGAAASIESVSAGVPGAEYKAALRECTALIASLKGSLPNEMAPISTNFEIIDRQAAMVLAAASAGDFTLARSIERKDFAPVYRALTVQLEQLGLKLGKTAEAWHLGASVASAVVIFGASSLLSLLLLRYGRKLVFSVATDAKRRASEANERRYRALIQHNGDAIALVDPNVITQFAGGSMERLLGYSPERLVGTCPLDYCHPDDAPRLAAVIRQAIDTPTKPYQTEVRMANCGGQFLSMEIHVVNLLDVDDVMAVLLTFHDLTERKAFEHELSHQAFHDKLTGLPNRALFTDRLSHQMSGRALGETISIMFLDVDNFKVINDSLGHEAGDHLLVEFSQRIRLSLEPCDTLSRIGGDEFVVLLEGNYPTERAIEVAKQIIAGNEKPLQVGARDIFVTVSIGIASRQEQPGTADDLIRDSDTAMYHAKNNGKSSYAVFDRSMNDHAVERMELESELRFAVERDELVLQYQPIVDIVKPEILEFEALVRWHHPARGVVPPLKFIPIAEENGLINSIGVWVLRTACNQLREWRECFPGTAIRMNVNVSGRQLQQADFAHTVSSILSECGVSPEDVTLEITESVMLNDMNQTRKVLMSLRKLGVRIAIDDFGTGYSSMSYLSQLPVDTLKIDRSFINALTSSHGEGIVKAIIAMARTLGLSVVSEGIETPAQLDCLKGLGCDYGQGYLFAKPLSAPGITALLQSAADEAGELKKAA